MKIVKESSTIDVEYEGRLENGELFDTSKEELAKKEGIFHEERNYEPLHVTLGQGMLIKGFEDALLGMHEEEEKTTKIDSQNAYGDKREDLIKTFPKDLERDKELKIGMVVFVDLQGKQVPAKVVGIDEEISLDFNHPLAGKNLTFTLKVVKIEE